MLIIKHVVLKTNLQNGLEGETEGLVFDISKWG